MPHPRRYRIADVIGLIGKDEDGMNLRSNSNRIKLVLPRWWRSLILLVGDRMIGKIDHGTVDGLALMVIDGRMKWTERMKWTGRRRMKN